MLLLAAALCCLAMLLAGLLHVHCTLALLHAAQATKAAAVIASAFLPLCAAGVGLSRSSTSTLEARYRHRTSHPCAGPSRIELVRHDPRAASPAPPSSSRCRPSASLMPRRAIVRSTAPRALPSSPQERLHADGPPPAKSTPLHPRQAPR
jgi:hypothetical protein